MNVAFKSVTSQFSLYCKHNHLKEEYQFYILLTASVMALFFTIVQDLFGRKKMILFCYILAVLGFISVYFSNLIGFKIIGLLCLWGFMEMVTPALALLSNELLVNPIRNFSFIFYTIMLCVGGLLGNYLTTKFTSYESLILFIFTGYTVTLVIVILLAPESPYYLLKSGKNEELRQVITRIGRYNRLNDEQIQKALLDVDNIIECTRFIKAKKR